MLPLGMVDVLTSVFDCSTTVLETITTVPVEVTNEIEDTGEGSRVNVGKGREEIGTVDDSAGTVLRVFPDEAEDATNSRLEVCGGGAEITTAVDDSATELVKLLGPGADGICVGYTGHAVPTDDELNDEGLCRDAELGIMGMASVYDGPSHVEATGLLVTYGTAWVYEGSSHVEYTGSVGCTVGGDDALEFEISYLLDAGTGVYRTAVSVSHGSVGVGAGSDHVLDVVSHGSSVGAACGV